MRMFMVLMLMWLPTYSAHSGTESNNGLDCEQLVDCNQRVDTRVCMTCLVRNPFGGGCAVRGNDPSCESSKAIMNANYEREYNECLHWQAIKKSECQYLKTLAKLKAESKGKLLSNGKSCTGSTECESGFCYPGVGDTKYCLSEKFNCALKDNDGAEYGQVITLNGISYVCARPLTGPASWMEILQ